MSTPITHAVDALAMKVAPKVAGPVDELHVAAVLESMGITDEQAFMEYGCRDVFALAALVYRRIPPPEETGGEEQAPGRSLRWTLRTIAHGPLYVMPSAAYPAVLITLGGEAMVLGLVFATALGWVWGMVMSSVAYQLLGQRRERAAARMLRLLSVAGLGIGAAIGSSLVLFGATGPGTVAFAVAQLGYQLASGIMVFYRQEALLALLMLPIVIVGGVHIITGYQDALILPALLAGAVAAALVLGAAWRVTLKVTADPDPRTPVARDEIARAAGTSASYAALCAALLLFTDARYVVAEFDVAIAVAPLVLGMGAVEWRAHRFVDKSTVATRRHRSLVEFHQDMVRLLLRELVYCLLILGGLGLTLILVLRWLGVLTVHGALLVDGHMVLGGAFFLGFVLMRHQRYGWLLGSLAVVVGANVAAVLLLGDRVAGYGEIPIFFASGAVLLAVFLVAAYSSIGRVRQYQ